MLHPVSDLACDIKKVDLLKESTRKGDVPLDVADLSWALLP
jgi:hypothetical protein